MSTTAADGLTTGSLTYPCTFEAPLAPLTPTGGRVFTAQGPSNSFRLMKYITDMGVGGNVLYCSALFQRGGTSSSTGNRSILFEFMDSANNRRFGLGIEHSGGSWINCNGSNMVGMATDTQTYFLVAKLVTGWAA